MATRLTGTVPQLKSDNRGIFVSYRREDSSGHAGRIFDNLAAQFGQRQIFMDVDSIAPGEDFVEALRSAVGACDVLIAIIGRQWLTTSGGAGRRLDDPNDFVRLEIATALERGIPVIPVLVQGATMPPPDALPQDLAKLSHRNALDISDVRWQHDVARLVDAIESIHTGQGKSINKSTAGPRRKRSAVSGPRPGLRQLAFGVTAVLLIAALIAGVWWWRGRQAPDATAINSIAVLPFVNRGSADSDYISDGLTESIINDLSQLPNLKVMSRNSVFRYQGKEIDAQAVAKELSVEAVLTGRVTQRGNALSVSVELVNARDNSQIWGQQYNRKTADVFEVQQEIASQISERLRLKLTTEDREHLAKRPTQNLKAFQYYMQGQSFAQRRTREDLLTAISYCEKAIAEDQNYALAYAGLADAYANLGVRGYMSPVEGRRKAEDAARKAVAIDDTLAEGHATLGQVHVVFAPSNFSLGDLELRRAIELSPSLAIARSYLGGSFVRQGRYAESLEPLLKARELDPLSSINARNVALPYYLQRDYSQALEIVRQANELGPSFSTTWEVGVFVHNGMFDEALAGLEKAKLERKNNPLLIYSTGMVYAAQGKRAEALQTIKELEGMSGDSLSEAHWIAKIYAALNEKELTLSWLERGVNANAIGAFYRDEPMWDVIRSDARFAELLRRLGIPT